jgi:choline dehydrogenase-like flavoprotein
MVFPSKQSGDGIMEIDARSLPAGTCLDADICIVGGGAAGLAMAEALRESGLSVILAESGGRDTHEALLQDIPQARSAGPQSFNLSGRRRQLGGGLMDWGANCALLDPEDFSQRTVEARAEREALLPLPLEADELAGYAGRAAKVLGPFLPDAAPLDAPEPPAGPGGLRCKRYVRARPEALAARLDALLSPAEPLRVLTRATLTGLEMDADRRRVVALRVSTGPGHDLCLRAGRVVLAAGADNAPLMMAMLAGNEGEAARRWPALGRYLHAHLLALHGAFLPAPGRMAALLEAHAMPVGLDAAAREHRAQFTGLRETAARGDGLLSGVVFLHPVLHGVPLLEADTVRGLPARLRPAPWRRHRLRRWFGPRAVLLRHWMEQPPRWEARVRLSGAGCASGLPGAEYEWAVGPAELATITARARHVGAALEAAGLGRAVQMPGPRADDPDIWRNAHPMGGTIMGHDPARSVVDPTLRVHGVENLFVCGGSVLPRGGAAMVTGVIVQLALRLADHLRSTGRGR